jgi:hypothetical protein
MLHAAIRCMRQIAEQAGSSGRGGVVQNDGAPVSRSRPPSSLCGSFLWVFPTGGLRVGDFHCLVHESILDRRREAAAQALLGLIPASTLLRSACADLRVGLCSRVGPVFLRSLGELDAVDVLKVEPSLQRELPRRHGTPQERAVWCARAIPALDTVGHVVYPHPSFKKWRHALASR